MPSSHTQVTAFFSAYLSLFSLNSTTIPILCIILLDASSLTVAWSRIYLKKHTLAQVGVGWIVGTVFGVGWYWGWRNGGEEVVWGLCRRFGIESMLSR